MVLGLLIYGATATLMFGALLNRVPDPFALMDIFHFLYVIFITLSAVAGLLWACRRIGHAWRDAIRQEGHRCSGFVGVRYSAGHHVGNLHAGGVASNQGCCALRPFQSCCINRTDKRKKGSNVFDGHSFDFCSDRAGGQPPDLAAQQEMGFCSHRRHKRGHPDHFDFILGQSSIRNFTAE